MDVPISWFFYSIIEPNRGSIVGLMKIVEILGI